MDGDGRSGQNRRAVATLSSSIGLRSSFGRGNRLRRTVAGALVAGAAALLIAGCGGGGTKAYSAAATKACLEKAGVRIVAVDEKTDIVAASALAGAVGAKLALNRVTISFGRSDAEGALLQKAYAKYGSKDVPIDQVLERRRNAVLLWAGAPSAQDSDVVRACLKG